MIYHGDMLEALWFPQKRSQDEYAIEGNPYGEEFNPYLKKQLIFETDEYQKGCYKREFRLVVDTFKLKELR